MANTENESLGRGNLLKTLTSQSNTSASNLPAYDIWSRDSKSLPPISPSQLSRDDSLTEFNASHYNSSIFPSLFQRLNTKPIQRAKMNTDLTEVTPYRPKIARSQKKSRTSFFDEMQHRNEVSRRLSLPWQGRWSTTDDFATVLFLVVLFPGALEELAKSVPVHS